jgi:hypothetical protein
MTTYAKGADVEALARSARVIKGMQAELTRIEATSRGAMRSIEAGWGGDNVRALVRHFNTRAVPGLQACSGVFEAMARRLEANVADQRSASGLGGSGGSGGAGGGGAGSGAGSGGGGLNDVTKTKGKKFQLDPDKQPDSMGDESGTSYRHTTQDGRHTYENATEGEDGRVRYDRYTHAGDYRDRQLVHESGWRSESESRVDRPWLPTDNSEDEDAFANRHPGASTAINRGVEGVNWMERTEHQGHTDYEPVYYDADGKVTDKEHAVRMAYGGGPGTEVKGYHEFGIKDGALAAGLGGTAGAYLLRGGVEGNLGAHGKYNASGFVGAEGKADASVSLGKDGLAAKANASAMVGVKGEAGVAYDNGPLAAHASGNAMAGAEAKADASVAIGKDGIRTSAGAEAFAGVKAGGEVGGSIAGVGGTAGGEVYAGIGAHANIDANFSAESVKVKVDVGAAIGIGGGVNFSVDVNPKEFLEDTGLGDVADGIGAAVKDPIGTIGGFFP